MRFWILFAGAAVCAVSAGAQKANFPEAPGREVFQAVCSACHEAARVLDKQWTRAEWKDKVLEMLQEEPDVTEKEREQIVDYLARNFAKRVNVNKATAQEIEAGLEISAKEAAAIVAYREKNGAIKSLDGLKNVPGLEARVVEANQRRVEF
jgi:competence ComEA-like helix-hairpin-helix protein